MQFIFDFFKNYADANFVVCFLGVLRLKPVLQSTPCRWMVFGLMVYSLYWWRGSDLLPVSVGQQSTPCRLKRSDILCRRRGQLSTPYGWKGYGLLPIYMEGIYDLLPVCEGTMVFYLQLEGLEYVPCRWRGYDLPPKNKLA